MSDWALEEGQSRLKAGVETLREVEGALGSEGPKPELEAELRGAIATLSSAMNWLEDTDYFEEAHKELHKAGQLVRETFGCQVHREGTTYYRTCPADLAHTRWGFSVGMVIRQDECSICHRPTADCEHLLGRSYDGERCYRIIKEADPLEISMVSRPAQPDARPVMISMDTADLQALLGDEFVPGVDLSCDKCIEPCPGVFWPLDRVEPPKLSTTGKT